MRMLGRWAPWAYLGLTLLFIFLPVLVLIQFSFQSGLAPVPPFDGPSLKWWSKVLANGKITDGLANSLLVGLGSAFVATVPGFGTDAAVQVRSLPSPADRVGLVAVTATALPKVREQAFAVGFDGFLVKPVSSEQLVETLENLRARRAAAG